jgi:exopolyphosphatase / guanosine-5'-triphosphate,3'-diphosphate pyrophosphatase
VNDAAPAQRPTRVAAIDCGTNTIRLLVADVTRTAVKTTLVDVHRELRVVRLGERVDATGILQPAAIDRAWAAMSDYTAVIRASGAVRVRMAATSATRDAANRQDFVDMVTTTLGQRPDVLTGDEEAALTFAGAVGDLNPTDGPFLVADIGGGSTELVVGSAPSPTAGQRTGRHGGAATEPSDPARNPEGAVSVDLGCVRLHERLLHGDPPTRAEIDDARRLSAEMLTQGLGELPVHRVRHLVAVAGTATTIAAAALNLPSYDPAAIHLTRLTRDQVERAGTLLLTATTAHRAALGYMHPGRVDVIGAGAVILQTLIDLVEERCRLAGIVISEHDILDGLALSLARES